MISRSRSFRLLPPSDKEFYEIFDEMAATVFEASELLIKLFEARVQDRGEFEIRIAADATRCAQMASSLEDLLRNPQQPPFGWCHDFTRRCHPWHNYIYNRGKNFLIKFFKHQCCHVPGGHDLLTSVKMDVDPRLAPAQNSELRTLIAA